MRRAIRVFACAAGLLWACAAPAPAAPTNGQLAAVVDDRLVALNPDGSGVRALPAIEQQISELAWSPDGNRLAIVHGGRISVLEPGAGRLVGVTAGTADANPGWSADGTRIGFRRGLFTYIVPSTGGTPQLHTLALVPDTGHIAWQPDLGGIAAVVGGALQGGLRVVGPPAYSPDGTQLAVANADGLSAVLGGQPTLVAPAPAEVPRWAPQGDALVYAAAGELRTVVPGAAPRTVPLTGRVTAVDWQPCLEGVTLSCRSLAPPQCHPVTTTVATEADVPVNLPAPPCSDPSGRSLSVLVTRGPEHGTLTGWRYTPAAGFAGQDGVSYRVTNGVSESEPLRLTILVTRRAATVPRPVATPAPVARAPFLTARATPRLDRRRRVRVRLSCDLRCSLSVRLEARVRGVKRLVKGPAVKRALAARSVLAVRLRLPARPRGTLRTVWITGRVRNAAGDTRAVRLPVRLPR